MTNKIDEKADELKNTIDEIGMSVYTGYTLADAIREGSLVTKQAVGGWGNGYSACALTAAVVAAKARGYVD
ncbi:hypothetical protein SEA_FAUST_105 [Streptomyces phage Faust]|uniref:Uncharacterized protein n=1 Tax=Streptomyces phage Faust TaxID=2767565 RepID=A0A7G9UYU7_9CAUD|nr:hypothetical protein PP456_gp157 [Streptomyces phage Faust]QNN99202.1 hypothetical protein SEA_FAUST_105 [Streptomyces phage Faust]